MTASLAARPNNPPHEIRAAQLTVAGRSTGPDDAAQLLEQLGIRHDPYSPTALRERERRSSRRVARAARQATAPL